MGGLLFHAQCIHRQCRARHPAPRRRAATHLAGFRGTSVPPFGPCTRRLGTTDSVVPVPAGVGVMPSAGPILSPRVPPPHSTMATAVHWVPTGSTREERIRFRPPPPPAPSAPAAAPPRGGRVAARGGASGPATRVPRASPGRSPASTACLACLWWA